MVSIPPPASNSGSTSIPMGMPPQRPAVNIVTVTASRRDVVRLYVLSRPD